jgi:hypothetical protein
MLTTDEAKRMSAIMLHGSPKTKTKADHIVRQLLMLPDAIRVNFDEVKAFLYELLVNEKKSTKSKRSKKEKKANV